MIHFPTKWSVGSGVGPLKETTKKRAATLPEIGWSFDHVLQLTWCFDTQPFNEYDFMADGALPGNHRAHAKCGSFLRGV